MSHKFLTPDELKDIEDASKTCRACHLVNMADAYDRLLAEVAALREVLGVCHTAISRAREIVGGTDESCCECDTDCFCYCCYYNGIKDRLAAALGKEPTP